MLNTERALHEAIAAEIEAHSTDSSLALYDVSLISSQYGRADFNELDAFIRVSIAEWSRSPYQTQEMIEYNVFAYLEAIVKPSDTTIEAEDEALARSTEIAQHLQDLLRDSELGGACSSVLSDAYPFQRGMSNRAGRFGVTVLPIIVNPHTEEI